MDAHYHSSPETGWRDPRVASQIADYVFSQERYDRLGTDTERTAYLRSIPRRQAAAIKTLLEEDAHQRWREDPPWAQDTERWRQAETWAEQSVPDDPAADHVGYWEQLAEDAAAADPVSEANDDPVLEDVTFLRGARRDSAVFELVAKGLARELDQARARLESGDVPAEREHEQAEYIEHLEESLAAASEAEQQQREQRWGELGRTRPAEDRAGGYVALTRGREASHADPSGSDTAAWGVPEGTPATALPATYDKWVAEGSSLSEPPGKSGAVSVIRPDAGGYGLYIDGAQVGGFLSAQDAELAQEILTHPRPVSGAQAVDSARAAEAVASAHEAVSEIPEGSRTQQPSRGHAPSSAWTEGCSSPDGWAE